MGETIVPPRRFIPPPVPNTTDWVAFNVEPEPRLSVAPPSGPTTTLDASITLDWKASSRPESKLAILRSPT